MKKSLLTMAALGAVAGSAHAESTVTLYGIVDAGITYTNNNGGHASWRQRGGNASGSRFGLTGAEDLGGGLKALFTLDLHNGTLGQGGRMFGRQAWVGLSSDHYGTLTLGRQYTAAQDILPTFTVAPPGYSAHPLDNDNLNGSYRVDNAVKYKTPNYFGFQADALYGFSNSTNFAVNRAWSLGASYANGPFSLGAAYVRLGHPAFGEDKNGAIPFDSYYGKALNAAQTVQQWGAGGLYTVGAAKFGLLYTGSLFESLGGGRNARFNNFEASVRYAFTPALTGALGQTYTHEKNGAESGNYWQTSVGALYFLSKRTDLYLSVTYQTASQHLHAQIDGAGDPSSNHTQVAAVTGIRHRF